jgi:hypothetical protein
MDATVRMVLKNLSEYPLAKKSRDDVLRAVNQHLKTMQFIAQKIEYSQKIIRIINNTIIPSAVDKATSKIHKDLIRTTMAPLTTSLQNKIRAFQAENVPDGDILQLEFELRECGNLIREADANKETPMHALPPNLLENLLQCQKSATQAIQRLDLMANKPMFSSSLSGEKKKEATRVLNLYGPKKFNLPEKAKSWADYFNARHEQEWAQMKKVAALQAEEAGSDDEEAQKVQGFHPQMKIQKTADFGERIRSATNMTGAVKTNPGGGRKTRKRKRRRKTRKRKKKTKRKKNKKKTKRKHKKRHHRTKRRK